MCLFVPTLCFEASVCKSVLRFVSQVVSFRGASGSVLFVHRDSRNRTVGVLCSVWLYICRDRGG